MKENLTDIIFNELPRCLENRYKSEYIADALIAAGVILPKFKIGQEVWVNIDCCNGENVCIWHDNDYFTGTGATECPFENQCNFEDCDKSKTQTLKTYITSICMGDIEEITGINQKGVGYGLYKISTPYEPIIYATKAEAQAACCQTDKRGE